MKKDESKFVEKLEMRNEKGEMRGVKLEMRKERDCVLLVSCLLINSSTNRTSSLISPLSFYYILLEYARLW